MGATLSVGRLALASGNVVSKQDHAKAVALTTQGEAQFKIRNNRNAFDDFTKAIALDPTYEPPYFDRAEIYFIGNFTSHAAADIAIVLNMDPDSVRALRYMGFLDFTMDEYDASVAEYTKAIRLEPNNPGIYYLRGQSYYMTGDFKDEIADYTTCIRLQPKGVPYWRARGYAYFLRKDYKLALADYKVAHTLSPTDDNINSMIYKLNYLAQNP